MSNSARRKIVEMHAEIDQLRADNASLKAELAEAKKDAERYRWLRDQDESSDIQVLKHIRWEKQAMCCALTFQHGNEDFDATIDSAMKGK